MDDNFPVLFDEGKLRKASHYDVHDLPKRKELE